jgi:hypothetical protein
MNLSNAGFSRAADSPRPADIEAGEARATITNAVPANTIPNRLLMFASC